MRCSGQLQRREFLRVGTLTLGGICLTDLLAAWSEAGGRPTQKSVILFWMWGGPSQLETWDMKPLAPQEYRGPFRPIPTTVPGVEICELFPLLAQQAHRFSIVRSLHHEMSAHNDGGIQVLTGKTPTRPDPTSVARSEHPDFGMVVSKMRGPGPNGLPAYLGIPSIPPMISPSYLGVSHRGFAVGDPSLTNFQPRNLTIDASLNATRLQNRGQLLSQFDRLRRDLDLNGNQEGISQFQRQAAEMLTSRSVADAFDLNQEDPRLRDRYGRHLWGQSCLLARRLAERGASVITVEANTPKLGTPLYFSWDDHPGAQPGWDMVVGMKWRAGFMDAAFSTLVDDVFARGMERDVMIVAMGEFGRSPRLGYYQGLVGRDHWPQAQSALVVGGSRGGQVIGATTSKAEHPTERPLDPSNLLATIYRHLGVDPRHEFLNSFGRPIPILPDCEPIQEFL